MEDVGNSSRILATRTHAVYRICGRENPMDMWTLFSIGILVGAVAGYALFRTSAADATDP